MDESCCHHQDVENLMRLELWEQTDSTFRTEELEETFASSGFSLKLLYIIKMIFILEHSKKLPKTSVDLAHPLPSDTMYIQVS